MAGVAVGLACLGKISEIFLGRVEGWLVAPISRQVSYMCCFSCNFKELETQFKNLETTREDVQMRVDENSRNARVVGSHMKDWLTSASTVANEVEEIIKDKEEVKEGCLNGWCPNLKLRYSLSRKAVKKTKVVVELKADGIQYVQPFHGPQPAGLEPITTSRDFMGFESRNLKMKEIIKALGHDGINLIGISGMGGTGKTTIAKDVAKRVIEDGLFDEYAWADVGKDPNLAKVQKCIADMLGLKDLGGTEGIERANLLRKRLLQDNKRILVILDDIWKEFILEDQGFPLEGTNKHFKMLYTSRTRDLWLGLRSKEEIPLELLSEDEAWQLFTEKAGYSADAGELQPLAKKIPEHLQPIAKQIVKECGRLPLALVLIGSALLKKSRGNDPEIIWQGMLDRLTHASSNQADPDLYLRLEPSYECLENKLDKSLFLLCCLFEEDEHIRIEDLARYGLGLSFFGGMNDMGEIRSQVYLVVGDLKSRNLLLDSENQEQESVKVHDVVRDMGIFIASKNKLALVRHGRVSRWPRTATYDHFTAISVVSDEIEELPEELAYPNIEFLMVRCQELKKLPSIFFEGLRKLKVLELRDFGGVLTLQSFRNLTTLSLEGFCGTLDNVSLKGGLPNLEILNLRDSQIKVLSEGIGELIKLRLLDLRYTSSLTRIPSGIISRLVHLEELYFWDSKYCWRNVSCGGEGMEEEGRNANLGELGGLSNLNTLEIVIDCNVVIPEVPIFSKLKLYKVWIKGGSNSVRVAIYQIKKVVEADFISKCKRVFWVESSILIPPNRGGIDSLLRSCDCLVLDGEGCNDLVKALLLRVGVDGLQQLKYLIITRCDTRECLANTMNQVHLPTVFPILKALYLRELDKLREICRGPVAARSFGELTFIHVQGCKILKNLFPPPIVECLTQLKHLIICHCDLIEHVISKENQEDIHVATHSSIVFPKLEVLKLEELPSLVGFCKGVDQIDFPELKKLKLKNIPKVNDNVGLFSIFPQQVSLPKLEVLQVDELHNLERLGNASLNSFSELKKLEVKNCMSLRNMFQEDIDVATNRSKVFPELEFLLLEKLPSLVGFCRGVDQIDFPQLKILYLHDIPQVNFLFHNDASLSSNSEQNENDGSISLFCQKVTLPKLEVLEVAGLQNLERLEHLPFSVGSLSKLKESFVHDCGKLLSVFPSQFVLMMQGFHKLTVQSCNSLEVVFESEGFDSNEQSLQISSQLKFVELLNLPQLNNIAKRDPASFMSIQTLTIHNCNSFKYVFAPTMTKSIPQLRKLSISKCGMLSRIVAGENGFGERSVDEVEFPLLESLALRDLPNLVSFLPNVNMTTPAKSRDQYNSPLQPQPLFNEKVAIPNLNALELHRLENVSDLWCSLELLTNSSSKLETLQIRDCSTLEVVVGKEEQVGDFTSVSKMDKPLFPQLIYLELQGLTNLKRFCNFNHPIEIPLLDELKIYGCPNMDAFSLGPVSTPNLSSFRGNLDGDLNIAQLLPQKEKEEEEKDQDVHEQKEEQVEGKEEEEKDQDVDEQKEEQAEGKEEEKENVDEDNEDQDERRKKEEKGKGPLFG